MSKAAKAQAKRNKQRGNYLRSGGTHCPFCGGADIRANNPQTVDLDIHCEVDCENCGKTWTDVYKLADIIWPNEERKDDGTN